MRSTRPRTTPDGRLHPSERLDRGVYWLPALEGFSPSERVRLVAVDRHGRTLATCTLLDMDAYGDVVRQLWRQLDAWDPGLRLVR